MFGKNYDWDQDAGLVVTNPRGLSKTALTLNLTDTPAMWTSKYGSITFNQYGVEMPNAGLNERGLVVEIMWLTSSGYPPADGRPVVNELQWIQHALDLYATVDELAKAAPSLRVSKAYAKVHYHACDSSGDCAAFEYIGGDLVITRASEMPAKTLANDTYAASVAYLAGFSGFGGTKAVPTSMSSPDRFVRASMLVKTTTGTSIPDSTFEILDRVTQPSTVWSMVYALKDGAIHFRTAAVPKVKKVSLGAFSFACGARKILDINTDAAGDVTAQFTDYSRDANLKLLNESLADLASALPAGVIPLVASYPDSCKCVAGSVSSSGSCSVARSRGQSGLPGVFCFAVVVALSLWRRRPAR